jgi:FMN phosphatase YigB (HAD superfamily)
MLTHITVPADITAVVLDLDGTIYRMPRMGWHMVRKNRYHLPSLIAERRWRKARRKALLEGSAMPKKPVSEEWYRKVYLPSMVQIIAEHYKPQPWLQPLLDECSRRKIKVIVLSDYESAHEKLHVLGLTPKAFDAVLSTGDLGTIKPDPDLGRILTPYITNNAAVNWQHVLIIGDREDTDGQLAKALGAQFLHV